jgi:hypothetical protein
MDHLLFRKRSNRLAQFLPYLVLTSTGLADVGLSYAEDKNEQAQILNRPKIRVSSPLGIGQRTYAFLIKVRARVEVKPALTRTTVQKAKLQKTYTFQSKKPRSTVNWYQFFYMPYFYKLPFGSWTQASLTFNCSRINLTIVRRTYPLKPKLSNRSFCSFYYSSSELLSSSLSSLSPSSLDEDI